MGYTQKLGLLAQSVFQDSSLNVGIGAAPSGTYKFEVTGTAKVSGILTLGSTISNGTYTYTLPSATGTLALTSALGDYLPLAGGTLTGALGGTSASFSSTATATAFIPSGSTVPTNGMYLSAANTLNFATNTTNRLSINSSGNVGIGANSSAWDTIKPIEVGQGGNFYAGFQGGSALYMGTAAYYGSGGWKYASNGNAGNLIDVGEGLFKFSNCVSGTTGGAITWNERMRITSGGNVCIGTTSTSYRLAVVTSGGAGLYISTSGSTFGNPSIAMINGATDTTIAATTDGLEITTYSSHSMYFRTATVERMRIYNDGYMSLNSVVFGTTTSGTVRTLYIGNGANYLIGGISSIRASKKNIENVSNVDWLYKLNPVTFNYRKLDENKNYTEEIYEDLNYGLIAEDTEPFADFLINYNDKEDGTKEMIGIEYPRLIIPLLKAIQELSAQNQDLKSRLDKAGL